MIFDPQGLTLLHVKTAILTENDINFLQVLEQTKHDNPTLSLFWSSKIFFFYIFTDFLLTICHRLTNLSNQLLIHFPLSTSSLFFSSGCVLYNSITIGIQLGSTGNLHEGKYYPQQPQEREREKGWKASSGQEEKIFFGSAWREILRNERWSMKIIWFCLLKPSHVSSCYYVVIK